MIEQALLNLRPGAQWTCRGGEYSQIEWFDTNQTQPTEEEVRNEILRIKKQNFNDAYKQKRAKEYPPIGDQLDALFHAGVFPPEMAAMIQAVKDKYPKEAA